MRTFFVVSRRVRMNMFGICSCLFWWSLVFRFLSFRACHLGFFLKQLFFWMDNRLVLLTMLQKEHCPGKLASWLELFQFTNEVVSSFCNKTKIFSENSTIFNVKMSFIYYGVWLFFYCIDLLLQTWFTIYRGCLMLFYVSDEWYVDILNHLTCNHLFYLCRELSQFCCA